MVIGDIETIYDEDTQKLIDFYNNQIAKIAEEYKNKMESATAINYFELLGGVEKLKREFEIRIQPFRLALFNIHLTAIPTYIIKSDLGGIINNG